MAAKKKSAAAKKKKKKASHPTGRAAAANPPAKKKKKKAAHRPKAANPKKGKKKKAHHASRPAKGNPSKGKKKAKKRHHKKNPDVPMWAMAAIGSVLGLVAFTAVSAGTFALTQRLDPSLNTLIRNRRIAAGLFTVGGVALAFVSPILGAGVAAGGLAVLAGTEASLALGHLIDKPASSSASSPASGQTVASQNVNGIFGAGRQQLPNMTGVFGGGRQQLPNMSGVFAPGGHQAFAGIEDGYGATAF